MLQRQIEVINKSDVGSVRPHNEDSTASDSRLGFAIVADGMGGYLAGEAASSMAVSSITSHLLRKLPKLRNNDELDTLPNNNKMLREAIEEANEKIYSTARSETDCKGMGTTMVAILFCRHDVDHICVAHVGDSRLYMLRDNKLQQITKDHSLIQEMIDKGVCSSVEEALEFVSKTYITRALGISRNVDVETTIHKIRQEDILLLCSDGLSDMLDDREIHRIMVKHSDNLERTADTLVKMANSAGGKDNISAVMVRILHPTSKYADEKENTTSPKATDTSNEVTVQTGRQT
ncbi:MAG: Stp1/IreP family PP2C-type Ser/Thr phosphatase [Candidatus Porifericomitaceae bacterium WSBS_2022_MAG_OTU9]